MSAKHTPWLASESATAGPDALAAALPEKQRRAIMAMDPDGRKMLSAAQAKSSGATMTVLLDPWRRHRGIMPPLALVLREPDLETWGRCIYALTTLGMKVRAAIAKAGGAS